MSDESDFIMQKACTLYGTKEVANKLSLSPTSVNQFLSNAKPSTRQQHKQLQKMLDLYPAKRNQPGGMKLLSFFAGAGGLDLGFQKAGFEVLWANEYDHQIWKTYERNHPDTVLDRRSITEIEASELPDCDGIIGGPPCQSWSEAGKLRGINDHRGQLFYDFIRILREKKPKFFLAENVSGILAKPHAEALGRIKRLFADSGYKLHLKLLNAKDYGVPQDRKRVFFVGIRDDILCSYRFPKPAEKKVFLKDAISDLTESAIPATDKNHTNGARCLIPNHEYMVGGFSSMFLSRNRVRTWDEPSFTIQAGGRHAPIHPQAPKMEKLAPDQFRFIPQKENLYRRMSVREAARIQTFPDDFIFYYELLAAGYKMAGNAVPVILAQHMATSIKLALKEA
jgi:DNA (cytosine-5)-methyltransferase 1